MSEITTLAAVRDAHTAFCENMDFEPDTWKAAFEFSAYVGFWCVNVARKDIRNEENEISVSHKARQRIDFLRQTSVEVPE